MGTEIKIESDHYNIEGIGENLKDIVKKADDSKDLEWILDRAISGLFLSLPQGNERYSLETGEIGQVWISRFNNRGGLGVSIQYTPSKKARKNISFIQATIGEINLREKYYTLNQTEKSNFIEEILVEDTKKVMDIIGLEYKEK